MLLSDLLNYGLYGLVGGLALIGLIGGMIRGIGAQTVKFALALGSFVLSFVAIGKVYPWLFSFAKGKTLSDVVAALGLELPEGIANTMAFISAEASVYFLAILLAIIVLPVIFAACYFLVRTVLWLPCRAFYGTLGYEPNANSIFTRILGGILGAVQGVLAAAVILMPIAGFIGTASIAINDAKAEHPDSANTVSLGGIYDANIAPLETNPVLQAVNTYFGFVYDSVTTVEVDGMTVDMVATASDAFEVFVLLGDLGTFDYTNLTAENKAVINEIIDVAGEDEYLSHALACGLNSLFYGIDNGHIILSFEEPMYGFLMSIIQVFETTNKTTLEADLQTVANVYYIFNDSGSLALASQGGDISKSLFGAFLITDENGKSTITLVTDELDRNERFHHVSENLSILAMQVLVNSVSDGSNTIERLESVKDGVNAAIAIDKEAYETEEEYKSAVSDTLGTTLEDNDIELSDEQLDKLTDVVLEEFGDDDEITDLELAMFMGKYYDVYASKTGSESGTPEGDTSVPDGGDASDGTVDDGTVDDGTVDDGTVDDGTVDDGTASDVE